MFGLGSKATKSKNTKAAAKSNNRLPLEVRLAGGMSPNSGRVEVRYHGAWGTVCKYGWDERDAKVVCRMLGYPGVKLPLNKAFKHTTGKIWLVHLQCSGKEKSIAKCSHSGWGISPFCDHVKDMGTTCALGESNMKQ